MSKIKEVLKLAIPAVGEMLLYMMVWVIDTAFVGNYGDNIAVSAVGLGSEILYTFGSILITVGISVGITTMVAQSIGAKKYDDAEKYLAQGILIGGIIAFILVLIMGTFSSNILTLFGAEGEVVIQGSTYMKIACVGLFFSMISSMLNAGLRGSGNTVTPLIASAVIVGCNVFLDYALIYGKFGFPELGTKGSAIATTISYGVGFLMIVYYYRKKSDFKIRYENIKSFNKTYIKKIVKLSIPSSMQEGAFSISRLLTLSFVMYLGSTAYAANQIVTTIESISYMPGWGFAVAATALVGQRIGAKDYKTAREYAVYSAFFGTGVMILGALVFILIPEQLMGIFIDNPETIEIGKKCLMFAALEQPFMGLAMVLAGSLKGAGDTKSPFLIALFSNWVIRVPIMYYVIFVLNLSVEAVWIVTAIQWITEGIIISIVFNRKSKKWMLKK